MGREGWMLSESEAIVYQALLDAAAQGLVCPTGLDLEMLVGCESCSTTPQIVARLERKGLIRVMRYQRFREVMIIATGQWTMRSPAMRSKNPHVPRGAKSRGPMPTDRKPYRTRNA